MGRTRSLVWTPRASAGMVSSARHDVDPNAKSRRSSSVHVDSSSLSPRSSRKSGLSAEVIVASTGCHSSLLASPSQPATRMSTSNSSRGEPPVHPILTTPGVSTAMNSASLSRGRAVLPDTVDHASGYTGHRYTGQSRSSCNGTRTARHPTPAKQKADRCCFSGTHLRAQGDQPPRRGDVSCEWVSHSIHSSSSTPPSLVVHSGKGRHSVDPAMVSLPTSMKTT
mmetsp:Transcript_2362/g.7521  ORF Transcript_2362/g.7521 Transcript_2362/m.7521 type:complete len:224 (+) Transcript_2362:164-835(+)